MVVKTYKIFENREVKLPWYGSKDVINLVKNIDWNENDTTIISAKVRLTIKPSRSYVKAWAELNYIEIGRFTWSILDDLFKSDEFDVIGVITNGSNYFSVTVAKEFANVDAVSFMISEDVVITYEGTEPTVKTDWRKYLEIGAIALGAIAATTTVAGAIIEEEKR